MSNTIENGSGSERLVVFGAEPTGFDLDVLANELRDEISTQGLPLAKSVLATQAAVMEVLLVVREHEDPHTHPNADLIFTVLEGGGWLQSSSDPDPTPKFTVAAGTTVVVPKGVCHAFHNTSSNDSVVLATFSPADPSHIDGCAHASSLPQHPAMHRRE